MSLDVELLISHLAGPQILTTAPPSAMLLKPRSPPPMVGATVCSTGPSSSCGAAISIRRLMVVVTAWDIGEDFHGSKLTRAPALKHGRDLRFSELN